MKGLLFGLFDFNRDGELDVFERCAELSTFLYLMEEAEKNKDSSDQDDNECDELDLDDEGSDDFD